MTSENWQRVKKIIDEALAADPKSWPSLLPDACGGDESLVAEVTSLLARRGRAEGFIETSALEILTSGDTP